jgi:rhodanese-related sulfurtransferase
MVGVGYVKGIGEDEERWLTPEEIEAKQQRGERLRFFDARHESEYAAGTLPGAESLAQTAIMFNRDAIRTLIDDLLSGAGGASDLVFFANTKEDRKSVV